jgi:hypothetical protein
VLVSVGFVLASPAILTTQNNWDPRVYGPLGSGIQIESTTKSSSFYNISLSMDAIESTTLNKILFARNLSSSTIQSATNIMVYVNGTALLKPLNLHSGDNVYANLLVPDVYIQTNTTYDIGAYTDSMFYCTGWNTNV